LGIRLSVGCLLNLPVAFLTGTFVTSLPVTELSRSMPPTTLNRKKLSTFPFPLSTILYICGDISSLLIYMKKKLSTIHPSTSAQGIAFNYLSGVWGGFW